MKNHWIKRKEDREKLAEKFLTNGKFRGKFQEAAPTNSGRRYVWDVDKIIKDMIKKDEWNHVVIQFDGTVSGVHVNGRALNDHEVWALYGAETTCKCGKTFKTNVGHTEECLKQLDEQKDENGFYK